MARDGETVIYNPGPQEYNQELSWKSIGLSFGAGHSKGDVGRKTFLDDAIQLSKKERVSPGKYNPEKYDKP